MSDLPIPRDPSAAPPAPVVSVPEPPAPQTLVCANCHAPLAGEYCAACGQRHEPHVHTVGHFAGEAFESISHADSRLWRTLLYLLGKPGHLTREFFDGRRVRYLPPFRLYLVISVLFFLVVGLSASGGGGEGPSVQVEKPKSAEDIAALNQAADDLQAGKMGNAGVVGEKVAERLRAIAGRQAAELSKQQAEAGNAPPAAVAESPPGEAAGDGAIKIATGEDVESGISQFCAEFETENAREKAPDANRDSVRRWCKRFDERGVAAIGEALLHNIPRAMFVFLPLLALFMRLLYWKPKRYYVEHLLFMVHNHAFVFLAATIVLLIGMIPFVGDYAWPLYWATFFYMAWYIYRAMRRVYGQNRGLTILKYLTLGYMYVVAGFSVFVAALVYSTITF